MSRPSESRPVPPASVRGLVTALDHVAIAVESIAAARPLWVDVLGLEPGAVEHVAEQKVNVLMVTAGGQRIELVEPASDDSPISRFLANRGGGIHHLAWRVDDIEAALERVRAAGLRLIDEAPRPGAHGTRTAFLHPSATGGVLTELVEVPA